MNNWALRTVPVSQFGDEVIKQASQLLSTRSIQDVCDHMMRRRNVNSNLESTSNENVFYVAGKNGSGRTTFCKAVLKELIQNRAIEESDILYVDIGKFDSINCVWNCGINLARAPPRSKKLDGAAISLASETSLKDTKVNAMVSIFDSFAVVCFDNLCILEPDHPLNELIMSIIGKVSSNVICVVESNTRLAQTGYLLEVEGLNLAVIGDNIYWQNTMQFLDTNLKSVEHTIKLNPKAAQLLFKASKTLNGAFHFESSGIHDSQPVCDVINVVWEHLSGNEQVMLLQLSELRQPLPIREAGDLSRLIKIGMVEYIAPGHHGNLFGEVILTDCVREIVLAKQSNVETPNIDAKFDVFKYWMVLLSPELVGLIEDARNNSWPFVPEKWQYVTNAGKEESYNIKDVITMKVENLPHLTHFDILQECLHHSVLRKDYENMAAILFLIDRYIYWQGGSETLLDLVDHIMKEKPELPIAPQLVIRKARVLRTSGNLQGAEKVLDKLLNERTKVGMWQYSEDHHYQLVKAVCVQIKGEIECMLGQWYNSAALLLDSTHGFKSLPEVDKKGLSCSLGLLVNTLQHMSVKEFQFIAQRYSLEARHPYVQAYEFAMEAAELAVYTPLFYARHKRRAGEMLLEYSKLCADELRSKYLADASKELKESLKAHKNLDSLKSREQYYEFINALYKSSCVLNLQFDENNRVLKHISMRLYDHYCRHQATIVHDVQSQDYINRALNILDLPSYVKVRLLTGGTTLRSAMPETISLESGSLGKLRVVDRCAETLETLAFDTVGSTVDRSKTTKLTMGSKSCTTSGQLGGNEESESTVDYDEMFDCTSTQAQVYECDVSSYDVVNSKWHTQRTLVYIGERLKLSEDEEGQQREPFMVEYLSQDEPMGKYLGKKYRVPRAVEQYKKDVQCQMTARYYVGLFNQELYHKGIEASSIQFLPVVMLTLLTPSGEPSSVVYNVEPYMKGITDFDKLTNNLSWVKNGGTGNVSKLVLAFSHFTYEISKGTLLITDHQGWSSDDHLSTTFLTDPQIHSVDKKQFGAGNLGMHGIKRFWQDMHVKCNEICRQLRLTRDLEGNFHGVKS